MPLGFAHKHAINNLLPAPPTPLSNLPFHWALVCHTNRKMNVKMHRGILTRMGVCTPKAQDIKSGIYPAIRPHECLTVFGAEEHRRILRNLMNLVTCCLVLFQRNINCINDSALWIQPTPGGKPVIILAGRMNPSSNTFILFPSVVKNWFFFFHLWWCIFVYCYHLVEEIMYVHYFHLSPK